MVVTVSTADPRSLKSLAILATADRWTKGHRKGDGRSFFSIPSSSGHVYWTDARECTCPDFVQRSPLTPGFACKHILAVRLWIAQEVGKKAEQPKPSRYAVLFPEDDDRPFCMACNRHHASNMHYGRAT